MYMKNFLIFSIFILTIFSMDGMNRFRAYAKYTYNKLAMPIISKANTDQTQKIQSNFSRNKIALGLLAGASMCAGYYYDSKPKNIDQMSSESLKKLYKLEDRGILFYIPKEYFKDVQSMKYFFEQYHILPSCLGSWNEPYEEEVLADIITNPLTRSNPKDMQLKDLPLFIEEFKTVLRSFLTNDNELKEITDDSFKKNEYNFLNESSEYIEKRGINRLFTCAFIQRMINEKKLSHVHLPRKILAIRHKNKCNKISDKSDDTAEQYLSYNEAVDFIERNIKIYFGGCYDTWLRISCHSKDYDMVIFAQKQKHSGICMNDKTYQELKELCLVAPFDVGYANIFSDATGDAIIIDTEYKGCSSQESIADLSRYCFKKS